MAVRALAILRAVGAVHEIHFDLQEAAGWDFCLMTIKVAASDEVAWVSFLFVVVARRYRLFQASLFVGFFWGLWYVPLVFAEIQVAPGLPIAPLIVNFVTIAAICGWLYQRTGRAAVVFGRMLLLTTLTGVAVLVMFFAICGVAITRGA